jgi:peptidoglycan LD-endopeptidase CwlK
MSSGRCDSTVGVSRDLSLLAPKFREAVEKAITECRRQGYDAYVYEAYRSMELQQLYYQRGRTVIPPLLPVTNAPSNLYSWHGYGLAVDVISVCHGWNRPQAWFEEVAQIFKKYDCRWGGDWKCKDLPHFQWGCCKPSPSDRARELVHLHGIASVWEAVDAA